MPNIDLQLNNKPLHSIRLNNTAMVLFQSRGTRLASTAVGIVKGKREALTRPRIGRPERSIPTHWKVALFL